MMDIELILQLLTIIAFIMSGINFVFISGAKIFWKLTFVKLEEEHQMLRKEFDIEKDKNSTFRHKHAHDVEGLETLLNLKIDFIKESIEGINTSINKLSNQLNKK